MQKQVLSEIFTLGSRALSFSLELSRTTIKTKIILMETNKKQNHKMGSPHRSTTLYSILERSSYNPFFRLFLYSATSQIWGLRIW
jgi:hypothetical protein